MFCIVPLIINSGPNSMNSSIPLCILYPVFMIIMETWSAFILESNIFGTWLIYQCTVYTFVFFAFPEPLEVFNPLDWFLYDNGLRHERVKWRFGSDYKISVGTFPGYPSIVLAHAQMAYFQIWLDFTEKLFGILKQLLSFTGYRHVVAFNFLKVYLLEKRINWEAIFNF